MILIGDCRARLAELGDASIDAVCTDPPYGLEFMGQDWDAPWKHGFSETGYSDGAARPPRPNFGSTRNPVCRTCRKHQRGTDRCTCPTPDFDERPADSNRAFQEWVETWATELLRVLKPGGHALVFGGTRTYHRLASGLEDAGFEIRDCIAWMYGSGFPKSLDVSKAIDAAAGAEREVVGERAAHTASAAWREREGRPDRFSPPPITVPATDDARQWEGWGTALKPAYEPIVVARKPLAGTVAATVLAHGTGALNIDGCRVAMSDADAINAKHAGMDADAYVRAPGAALRLSTDPIGLKPAEAHALGRWPANVALGHSDGCVRVGERQVRADGVWPGARPAGSDLAGAAGHAGQDDLDYRRADGETVEVWECVPDCPVRILDEQTGDVGGGFGRRGALNGGATQWGFVGDGRDVGYGDRGGASRFFYTAKASRAEREAGLDDLPLQRFAQSGGGQTDAATGDDRYEDSTIGLNAVKDVRNVHPTVKPVAVMRWLVRLVTPPEVTCCPRCEGQFEHDGTEAGDVRAVRGVRQRIRGRGSVGSSGAEVLQPDVLEPDDLEVSDVGDRLHDGEGLSDAEAPGAPDGDEGRLRDGAPSSDGGAPRTHAAAERGSSPLERRQDGQQDREPRADEQVRARPAPDASDTADRMSALREADQDLGTCGRCGDPLTKRPGRVLDPFTGSGTTGIACALEGFQFVGVEQSEDYAAIAEARIAYWTEHGDEALRVAAVADTAERGRRERADAGQLDLFAENA